MSPIGLTDWFKAFDMKTSIFIYLLVLYISSYVLSVTWIQSRKRFKGIGYFILYFFCLALGVSLALFRGALPDLLTVVLANSLMFTGNAMLVWGMGRFLGIPLNKAPYLILGLGFISLYAWFTFSDPDIRMRIMLFSAMTLPMLIHIVYLIFFKADAAHRKYALNTGITMALFGLVYLSRIYCAYFDPVPGTYFNTPMPDTFHHILGLCLTVLLTLSLHLMINGKLVRQTECHARALEELASRDGLTNLYNRRKMESLLKKEFYRFQRYGCPFSVIICDIDHFKLVNDTKGHDAGDRALISVADILKQNIRSEDAAGRWGGEEFLILLPESTEKQGADTAEKLRKKISGCPGSETRISLSFGVAQAVEPQSLNLILKHADQALYNAKKKGRNQVVTHAMETDR